MIRGGTLIDGTGADPPRDATLVSEGDTIRTPSRDGDVLVVDGDPLAEIAVLQSRDKFAVIMKDGVIVKHRLRTRVPA